MEPTYPVSYVERPGLLKIRRWHHVPSALRSAKYGVLVLFTCVRAASINILRISGSSASATGIPNRSAPPCLLDLSRRHSWLYSVQSFPVVCCGCSDIGPGICPYVVGVSTSTCEVKITKRILGSLISIFIIYFEPYN
jgi:hypothetical protein